MREIWQGCGAPQPILLVGLKARNQGGAAAPPYQVRETTGVSRCFEPVKDIACRQRQGNLILQIREIDRWRVRHVRPIGRA
jgi:hypothetical protein